jgi:protein-L-isoaspartate(D-aspartate) O-methyltransferase
MAQEPLPPSAAPDDMLAERRVLVETVAREIAWSGIGDGSSELDPKVIEAMLRVARERFVPPELKSQAYDNRPLPIGHDQTISQPLIVAVMTHLLRLPPDARVLEVGTGSGYQCAILAELAAEVVTLEVIPALAGDARAKLEALGYRNIEFHVGDGAAGWPPRAPYDAILVTAAARGVPPALIEQLKPGGRLVIPIGGSTFTQDLVLVEKDQDGRTHRRTLFPVAFVPLRSAPPAGP